MPSHRRFDFLSANREEHLNGEEGKEDRSATEVIA